MTASPAHIAGRSRNELGLPIRDTEGAVLLAIATTHAAQAPTSVTGAARCRQNRRLEGSDRQPGRRDEQSEKGFLTKLREGVEAFLAAK